MLVQTSDLDGIAQSLASAMLTGDLVGRAQVLRQARRAGLKAKGRQVGVFQDQPLPVSLLASFALEPMEAEEAFAFFSRLVPMTRAAFDRLAVLYQVRAFTFATLEGMRAVELAKAVMERAIVEGMGLREFHDALDDGFAAAGFAADNPHHVETVFRTNLQTAFNAARYDQYADPEIREFFAFAQYHTVGDDRVRPNHAAMDGFLAPLEDPVWDRWWPPNGFNCRCGATMVTKAEVKARGLEPDMRPVPEPDEGFAKNPARIMEGTA